MKKYVYFIFSVLISGLVFQSCSDNDYTELDKGRDALTLTASQSADQLNETYHSSDAITLNWTTGNNYGTGNRIQYKLELTTSGGDFSKSYVAVNNESQVYSWTASEENLNNIVRDKFGAVDGQPISIDARVIASVIGTDQVQTSMVTFQVTPYTPVTATLYLLGDATPNGWSADKATELTRSDNGIFSWTGYLKAGSFKLITTLGQFLPSYNKGTDGNLVYRNSDSDPDEKFSITEAHYYKVDVNLLNGTITYVQTEGDVPAFDNLFFVGNPSGWNFISMSRDPLDHYLFRYGHYFAAGKGGEFKFGTAQGNWGNMYKATVANASYKNTSMQFVSEFSPDNKWYLQDSECDKAYKICVDIRTGKERMMMKEFSPYSMIYLVGDATPNGWDLGNATQMTVTSNPYAFTWTGNLKTGELKFSCDKQSDWNGAWFMCANGNDLEPTGKTEQALFINKSDDYLKAQYKDINIGSIDNKWKIVSAGTYTITLNQLEETISIVKQ
jgi:hypothetical protein